MKEPIFATLEKDFGKGLCGCNLKKGDHVVIWTRKQVACQCCHSERLAMLAGEVI